MSSITTADVRAFTRKRLEAGAAPGEINRELAVLKRMFTLCIKANKLMVRPYIPMLAENNVRAGFFERDAFEAMRAGLPAALRPVVTFAYLTGWRMQSEILTLEWRQVDLEAGTVRLNTGTTNRNGRPIRSLRKAWQIACEAAGMPNMIPHDLRRTAVRNLERAGVSRSVAMQLTGHKTESVYRRYAIVSEGDLGEGIEKLRDLATGTKTGTKARSGSVRRFRRSS